MYVFVHNVLVQQIIKFHCLCIGLQNVLSTSAHTHTHTCINTHTKPSIMLMHLIYTNGCSLSTYPGVPVKVHMPSIWWWWWEVERASPLIRRVPFIFTLSEPVC